MEKIKSIGGGGGSSVEGSTTGTSNDGGETIPSIPHHDLEENAPQAAPKGESRDPREHDGDVTIFPKKPDENSNKISRNPMKSD